MSDLQPDEQSTLETYDAMARTWSDLHADPSYWKLELDGFQSLLPKGEVLEIGTGGARDAPLLIERGYGYTGSDISAGLIKVARQKLPGVSIVHQSVYELDFKGKQFDGFWASAVLLHVPKDRIDEALQRMRTVLKDGAIGFISLKEGTGEQLEHWDETKDIDRDRLFVYYTREEFTGVLARNKFEIVDYIYHPMSQRTRWLCFFVRKLSN